MNVKDLVVMALFVAIGAVLHLIVPGFGSGMKPDFSLLMLFMGIIFFPHKKHVLLLGLATGVVSGLTTTFPMGFFPNVIDKFVTAFAFYGLLFLIKHRKSTIVYSLLALVGTLISGTVFLTSAVLLVGLPAPFLLLFLQIVIPAMLINSIVMALIYPAIYVIVKRTKIIKVA